MTPRAASSVVVAPASGDGTTNRWRRVRADALAYDVEVNGYGRCTSGTREIPDRATGVGGLLSVLRSTGGPVRGTERVFAFCEARAAAASVARYSVRRGRRGVAVLRVAVEVVR